MTQSITFSFQEDANHYFHKNKLKKKRQFVGERQKSLLFCVPLLFCKKNVNSYFFVRKWHTSLLFLWKRFLNSKYLWVLLCPRIICNLKFPGNLQSTRLSIPGKTQSARLSIPKNYQLKEQVLSGKIWQSPEITSPHDC